MVSISTECGRTIFWTLIDPGPSHKGWLGFDFVVVESSGLKVIDIQFRRDAAYLAVECGDDLHDLLEQTWSGKVSWNNSDERDLVIRGDRENDLYRLGLLAEELSVRCILAATSLERFVYSLGLERDRILASMRICHQS